jgi:hypothetical protein
MKKVLLLVLLFVALSNDIISQRRLDFVPSRHGFHFPNLFKNHTAIGSTDGLCGGMALAAFNYYRYRVPIPPHVKEDIDYNVNFDMALKTSGAEPLIDYLFHSQIATFTNVSIASFIGVNDPDYSIEFQKAKERIDRGEFLILGLKAKSGGIGHQVLCYGYDPRDKRLIVYDPNKNDRESSIVPVVAGGRNEIQLICENEIDDRFKAIFEQQELLPNVTSDRVSYDMMDNAFRNLNYAVRPPANARPRPRPQIAGNYREGQIHPKDIYRFQNPQNQKYIEVEDGTLNKGKKVQQFYGYERNGLVDGKNQQWLLIPAGKRNNENVFFIINYGFLKYMNAGNELTVEEGMPGSDQQLWVLQPASGANQFFVRSYALGKYLETIGTDNAAPLKLTEFNGKQTQVFTFIRFTGVTGLRNFNLNQFANITPAYNDKKAVDATGGAYENNIQLTLQDRTHGRIDQQWMFSVDEEGYYEIKSRNSGARKCLEIFGFSMDDRGIAECWDCVNGINQKWIIIPVAREPGKYIFFNKNSGRCLNVSGGNISENGAKIIQYKFINLENCKWKVSAAL